MANCDVCKIEPSYKNCDECVNLICRNQNCAQDCVSCDKVVCEKCRQKSGLIHFRCTPHQNEHLKK